MNFYLDGADLASICHYAPMQGVAGFTTNPSLLRAAGVTDYAEFGKLAAAAALGKPISFEVLGDEIDAIVRQAHLIDKWGSNVFVKVPVTNSRGQSMLAAVTRLAADGIKVNVTALMTSEQVAAALQALVSGVVPCIVSLFAGRIADTGQDPEAAMQWAAAYRTHIHYAACTPQLLWASTREIFNIEQASRSNADIITLTPELYVKAAGLWGKDLRDYSRETVIQFLVDGQRSGLTL